MRAYVAILKDSFREAMASRVMLFALISIVTVLLLLAPFGMKIEKATELRRSEVTRPERILTELSDGADQENTPAAHIWGLFSEQQKQQLNQLLNPDPEKPTSRRRGPGGSSQQRELVNTLNSLLDNPDFYDQASWSKVKLADEADELISQGDLAKEELKRRNLLLLVAAFPRSIEVTDDNAISLTYAGATVIPSLPITPQQYDIVFERVVIEVLRVFLGFFGIFASLLFTAGLIPRTFEPGEISLLLSKPVNRGGLFVTKFLGGCTFTLLYSSVLVVGIWILLGTRMNFWRIELLWCIPVYVFLFMIYFSVSALAGAIWRNSIVALCIVLMFWLGITVVGVARQGLEENLIRSHGIKEITMAGSDLMAVDGEQKTYQWNSKLETWDEVFREPSGNMSRFFRQFLASDVRFQPVYNSQTQQMFALQFAQGRFGGLAAPQLVSGSADDDWERVELGRLPEVVSTILIDNAGRVILPASNAIYEYIGQTEKERKHSDFLGNISGGLLGSSKAFQTIQPPDMPELDSNPACALNAATSALLIFSDGKLHRLDRTDDGTYVMGQTVDLETEEPAVLTSAGEHCLLAFGDGRILMFKCTSLETITETQLAHDAVPRLCTASPDGSWFAVLTHDETVQLIDGKSGESLSWVPPENGACSAVAWTDENQLLVSDGRLAVRQYDVSSGDRTREWSQQTTWVYQFFDGVIYPLWTILPKPSQLDECVYFVIKGEKSFLVNEANGPPAMIDRNSLQQERTTFDAVQVIRDNAIFVVLILALGCFYVSRRDF